MTNAFSLFRSLVVYSICLPLAMVVGYLLANSPSDFSSLITLAIMLCLLSIPLFLRWHYPWLILTWNMSAIAFFLPGRPPFSALMILISFAVSILQYILNRQMKFISVPMVTRPLLFILLVVVITARLTGGIGLNALGGGANVGGGRYIALFLSIMGFFALCAVRIPPHKRKLYILLYFGGALTLAIANLALVISPGFSFIFLVFPTDQQGVNALADSVAGPASITRLGGLSSSSLAIIYLMLAFFGTRGFLDTRKYWRLPVLLLLLMATLFGGFRSQIITIVMMLGVLFYMEGLTRTRIMPALVLLSILVAAIALPSIRELPPVVQRSLAFLPLDIDPEVAANAQASTEWRINMWEDVLPEVPQYLLLGKGLGINLHELDMHRDRMDKGQGNYAGAELAGDYHNGPLSLIIPFGLFGVAGFVWFLVAGIKVLHRNYKFGDPDLLIVNRFFLAQFVVKIILFCVIFGSFYGDLIGFIGIVGFSIALNHGVAKPAENPVPRPAFNKFKLANAAR